MKRNSWIVIVLALVALFIVTQPLSIVTASYSIGYVSSVGYVRVESYEVNGNLATVNIFASLVAVDDYPQTDRVMQIVIADQNDYTGGVALTSLNNEMWDNNIYPFDVFNANAAKITFDGMDANPDCERWEQPYSYRKLGYNCRYTLTQTINSDSYDRVFVSAGVSTDDTDVEQYGRVVQLFRSASGGEMELGPGDPTPPDSGSTPIDTTIDIIEDIISPEGGDNSLMIVGIAVLAIGAFVFLRR